jgi:hypothetical protein
LHAGWRGGVLRDDAGGVTYGAARTNSHHEMSTKPDRFVDQSDADVKALEFLEAVARAWHERIPGVTIHHVNHERSDGRTSYVFGNGEKRLLAVAVVVRDCANYSLLVTKLCDFEPKAQTFRACDQCEHFDPSGTLGARCRQDVAMDFVAPRDGTDQEWGHTRPDCEHYAKAKA